jgi:uncharacterized membrane protein HdeD (DUF308 family)
VAGYSVIFGILLIVLGGWGYFGSAEEHRHWTALFPAFFGLALLLLGLLAFKAHLRKHAMHAAAALGLLGLIGGVVRLVMKYAKDGNLEGRAPLASGLMALACAVFVGMCVNSFIAARRARTTAEK